MRWPHVVESHGTELGEIVIERRAKWWEAPIIIIGIIWTWLATLIVDMDEVFPHDR